MMMGTWGGFGGTWGQEPHPSRHDGDGEGTQVAVVALWGQDRHPSRHCDDDGDRGWLWWHFGVRTPTPQGTA